MERNRGSRRALASSNPTNSGRLSSTRKNQRIARGHEPAESNTVRDSSTRSIGASKAASGFLDGLSGSASISRGANETHTSDMGKLNGPAQTGNFIEETEVMASEGKLGVWPYSVRKGASAAQRLLKLTRESVESKESPAAVEAAPTTLEDRQSPRELAKISSSSSSSLSSSVQFMPVGKPELTAAQAATMDILATELAAVERDEAKAVAALSRCTAEHRAAQAELQKFAARAEQARQNLKLRRPPPPAVAPLPPPLFQETAKAHARAAAKARWRAQQESDAMAAAAEALATTAAQREEARRRQALADAPAREARDAAGRGAREAAAAAQANAQRLAAAQAQQRLDDAARQSQARQVLIECPGCGEILALAKLPRHQREECENRKVPCKNFEYGCPCLVRVRDRARHEDASSLIRPRSCLWFGGPQAANRVALDEEDLAPPWTAEYWVWRPPCAEAAVALVAKALELRVLFTGLYAQMADVKYRVDSLEGDLVNNVSAAHTLQGPTSLKQKSGSRGLDQAAEADAEAERSKAAAEAANATKNAASLLLGANDMHRKVAVQVAAARAAYVDVLRAAGRRLAEADAELEDSPDSQGNGGSGIDINNGFPQLIGAAAAGVVGQLNTSSVSSQMSPPLGGYRTKADLEAALFPLLIQYAPHALAAAAEAAAAAAAEKERVDKEKADREAAAAKAARLAAVAAQANGGEPGGGDGDNLNATSGDDKEIGQEIATGAVVAIANNGPDSDVGSGSENDDDDENSDHEQENPPDAAAATDNADDDAGAPSVVRMALPEDWLAQCYTPRLLIDAIKGRASDEKSALTAMLDLLTESQGTKKKGKKDKVAAAAAAAGTKKVMTERARKKAKRKTKVKAAREEKAAEVAGGQGLPFAEEVSRAVKGRLGRDTIACSESGLRLQLEVGDRDELGISVPDLGEFVFTDAPAVGAPGFGERSLGCVGRGRWQHVAFVCNSKGRLLAFLNGHAIPRKPGGGGGKDGDKSNDHNDDQSTKASTKDKKSKAEKGGRSSSSGNGGDDKSIGGASASSKDKKSTSQDGAGGPSGSDKGLDLRALEDALLELRRTEALANSVPGSKEAAAANAAAVAVEEKVATPIKGEKSNTLMEDASADLDSSKNGKKKAKKKRPTVLGLPMRDIGEALGPGRDPSWGIGGSRCFHGALQEVRYWTAARSKGELRGAMHTLLDDDAPATQGLAGWWTLEEGGGNYTIDVTEGRFRSQLQGLGRRKRKRNESKHDSGAGAAGGASANGSISSPKSSSSSSQGGLKWVESEEIADGAEPPTPAWRERAACAVRLLPLSHPCTALFPRHIISIAFFYISLNVFAFFCVLPMRAASCVFPF